MKIKLIIICFISIFFSFLIYKFFENDKVYILSLGDDLSLGTTPFHTYEDSFDDFFKEYLKKEKKLNFYNDFFLNKSETYKSINQKFDVDYFINVKNENMSLRKSIADADIIIISLSNEQNFKKCNLSNEKYLDYFKTNIKEIQNFYNKVKMINDAYIIVIGNYCFNYNEEINNEITTLIKTLPKNIHYINLYKTIHDKSIYLPNDKIIYPSLEGYYHIFEQILNIYENLKF